MNKTNEEFIGTVYMNITDKEGTCLLSLPRWIDEVKSGSQKDKIEKIRTLLSMNKVEEARKLKQSLPAFIANVQCMAGRTLDKVEGTNELVMVDYDRHNPQWSQKMKDRVWNYLCLAGIYITPSGGLRMYVVTRDNRLETYRRRQEEVERWLDKLLDCDHDSACSNPVRASFYSNDQDARYRKAADCVPFGTGDTAEWATQPEPLMETEPTPQEASQDGDKGTVDISSYLAQLEYRYALLPGQRNDSLCRMGQCAGRDQLLPQEVELLIQTIYRQIGNREYSLAAISKRIWWGYQHSEPISKSKVSEYSNIGGQNPAETDMADIQSSYDENERIVSPLFDESLYQSLPSFFQPMFLGLTSPRSRDLRFIGIMTSLSFALPNMLLYIRNQILSPNLYSVIIGPAGSGKSVVQPAIHLLDGILNQHHQDFAMKLKEYKQKADQWEQEMEESSKQHRKRNYSLKPEEEEPREYLPLITGNISKSMLIKTLAECKHGVMIYCTEIDTLTEGNKLDCGNWWSELRSIYQNEPVGYSYKNDPHPVWITFPKATMLALGTPGQMVSLLNNVENGLFSRLNIYSYNAAPDYSPWADIDESKTNEMNQIFEDASKEVLEMYQYLEKYPTHLVMPEKLRAQADKEFERLDELLKLEEHDELLSVVHRGAITLMRYCAVLAGLRKYQQKLTCVNMKVTQEEFNLCMPVVYTLMIHACQASTILYCDKRMSKTKHNIFLLDEIYQQLPVEFTTARFIECCMEKKLCRSAAYNKIKLLLKMGWIRKGGHGLYCKKR